jgi:AspT/YidE/YbjL antiporter-like protein
MEWIKTLFSQQNVANTLVVIALIVAVGLTMSKIKMGRFNLGVTWILFAGIAAGQLGLSIEPCSALFIKEFGLILFIYSIGIEVGPKFFAAFKSGGLMLNGLAALIVALGCGTALAIGAMSGTDPAAMVGVLYGAVTNTPGLGAAQQAFADLGGGTNPLFAQGYAMAYPLGVVGIIVSIMLLKALFRIDLEKENALYQKNAARNGLDLQRELAAKQKPQSHQPNLFFIFFGIALGVVLGMLPIHIPGMWVPVKIGLAGGPLIVSILLTYFGPRMHINTHTTESANLMIRQVGISLFMAAVGLGAGKGFLQTVLDGGYMWVLYGLAITMVPCLLVGIIARWLCHLSHFTIAGLISGATTDPPALAYSNDICGGSQASIAYTTVYPLSMFLRVLAAQLMVIFTCV